MENTLTIFVERLHEHWDMPDPLALKWTEYEKGHPIDSGNNNADQIHEAWLATLAPDEREQITRRRAKD